MFQLLLKDFVYVDRVYVFLICSKISFCGDLSIERCSLPGVTILHGVTASARGSWSQQLLPSVTSADAAPALLSP